MSTSHTRQSAQAGGAPQAPHPLKDLLAKLTCFYRDPEMRARLGDPEGEVRDWFYCRVQHLSALPLAEIQEAAERFADSVPLEGAEIDSSLGAYGLGLPQYDRPVLGAYGDLLAVPSRRSDLLHVAERLLEMDADGRADRLWRELCLCWPWLDEVARPRHSDRGATPAL